MEHLHKLITLVILSGAVVLLVGNFIRNDLVAILIIVSLMVSGVLNVSEALSGFSSNAVIIIACMFVVGKAIIHTGIAQHVGEAIIRYGGTSEVRLLIMIMWAAGIVGAFMSSTATAAIFIPITLTVAEKANLNHKRLLMPLAVASLISGMMTLVATTPNIIINSVLRDKGLETFSFFSFSPFGVLIMILSVVFMALLGQNILAAKDSKVERKKEPSIDDLLRYHQVDKFEYHLRVLANSDLTEQSLAGLQLGARYHVNVLALQSFSPNGKREISPVRPESMFKPGDLLMVIGTPEHVAVFARTFSLQIITAGAARRRAFFQAVGIAEVMLNPESSLIGKSVRETLFQTLFHSLVLGIRRKGETLTEGIADMPLKFGDVLLVCGAWEDILRLGQNREQYLLLTLPQDRREYAPGRDRQKVTLLILAAMVAMMVLNLMPAVTAILAAVAALVLARCVPLRSVYDVVDWQTIVMIAGILPLALAMQKTGISAAVSAAFLKTFTSSGPYLVLAGLFLGTALLGLVMSNTAVAVLIAPMAIEVGQTLNISPQACAMTVAIACSAAFVSPLGSAVNMLVREPGGYSMKDYAGTGIPLLILSMSATVLLCRFLYM